MKRPRILLAEDSRAVARQLHAILSRDFDVVASVEDGQSLLRAAGEFMPDIVVTDISMPGMDGLDAATELVREGQHVGLVFITVHTDTQLVDRVMRFGPCGYVLKSVAGEDLVPAIYAVLAGSSYVSASLGYQPAALH